MMKKTKDKLAVILKIIVHNIYLLVKGIIHLLEFIYMQLNSGESIQDGRVGILVLITPTF
jgi:hypothetical protein